MTYGEAIRHMREAHGLSLRLLASRSGVSSSYLHDVETGRRPPFADERVRRSVYRALGLDASQRVEMEVIRVLTLGSLDISRLSDKATRELIVLRDELRLEEGS